MLRFNGRAPSEMRAVSFTRNFTPHAEGSVLVCYGNTKVICTASIESGVPPFMRDSKQGWLTAEYGMLPRATHQRSAREAAKGKQGGRTVEIQRLIGRSLRAAIDLTQLGNYTITIDCDVIQADGGTRTASISGGCVALFDAVHALLKKGVLQKNPLKHFVAAVSVGIHQGIPILDLDYSEDSAAHTDMNIVMSDANSFIEIQGTAENNTFSHEELTEMLLIGKKGITEIFNLQKAALLEEPKNMIFTL